jgi:pyruvate/2-oxoglutarate dehydrogenase complex dihydrolipoamide dehydrogenase (E3) component
VYEVEDLVSPLGIDVTPEGFIEIDTVSRRTAHPKVWAGGDVTAGRGNHGAAYAGQWAARAIDAYLNGRYDEWRAEAAASNDAELLIRGSGE